MSGRAGRPSTNQGPEGGRAPAAALPGRAPVAARDVEHDALKAVMNGPVGVSLRAGAARASRAC